MIISMGTLQLVDCITVSFLFGLHNIFVCYEGYCVRQLYSRKFLPCLGQEAWHTTCWFIVHNVTWKELLRANFHSMWTNKGMILVLCSENPKKERKTNTLSHVCLQHQQNHSSFHFVAVFTDVHGKTFFLSGCHLPWGMAWCGIGCPQWHYMG